MEVINGGICKMADCKRPHRARGYCGMHYARVVRHGNPHTVLEGGRPYKVPKKGDPPPLTTQCGLRGYLPTEPLVPFLKQLAKAERLGVLARKSGLSVDFLCRAYKKNKWIRWDMADRVCCAMKMHPVELWPFEWTAASESHSRGAA